MSSQCSAMFVLLVCLTSLVSDISSIKQSKWSYSNYGRNDASSTTDSRGINYSDSKTYFQNIQYIKLIGAPGDDNYLAISQLVAIDIYDKNYDVTNRGTLLSILKFLLNI